MMLSKNNLKLVTNFFLGNTKCFDKKDDEYKNLLLAYATDNNSSTLRELATMNYLKYKSFTEKLGPDGIDLETGVFKEVKPKTIKSDKKSGGSGNFNDMTLELLEKKKDYDIICSLFKDSRFVYIVEFPMSSIYEKLKQPILKAKLGKRVVCNFSYKDYDPDVLKVHYLNKELIHSSVSKKHAKLLIEIYDNKSK